VSFISLQLALPPALALSALGACLVALIKPQFEVGKDRLPKDGVVKDPDLHQAVCDDISRFVEGEGWLVLGIVASPIEGGDGNREFLLAARKT
jgi:23S rRNA (cytidine1920-2'-O)/16S rRNA (cytidine1409-2'-O)-methyltransferase